MGEIKTYFFDTYSFFEIIEGRKEYEEFIKEVGIVTTKMNLMELHYGLLIKKGKETADKYYDELSKFTVEIEDETIKLANVFKSINKKMKLSYIDCIGYILAKKLNIPFLTGDKEFKYLDNVEFVK